jgi:hypothetical protein
VAVPVVVQTGLELVPLAGEAVVERGGAGDGAHLAIGQIACLPDHIPVLVGHHERALEMIGVDIIEVRCGHTGFGNHGQRPPLEPDVFGDEAAGGVVFGDHIAIEIVHHVQGERHGVVGTRDHARQVVIEIGAARDAALRGRGKLAGGIVAVGLGQWQADGGVFGDVAGPVRLEAAARRAIGEDAAQPVGIAGHGVFVGRAGAARRAGALDDVADPVCDIGERAPGAERGRKRPVCRVGEGLAGRGVELILDRGEVALVLIPQDAPEQILAKLRVLDRDPGDAAVEIVLAPLAQLIAQGNRLARPERRVCSPQDEIGRRRERIRAGADLLDPAGGAARELDDTPLG